MLPAASHGRDSEGTNSKPAKTRRKAQETPLTLPPTRGPPTGDAEADEGGGARRRKTKKNKRERHMEPQGSKRPRKEKEDKNKKRKRNENQRSMDEFTVTQARTNAGAVLHRRKRTRELERAGAQQNRDQSSYDPG